MRFSTVCAHHYDFARRKYELDEIKKKIMPMKAAERKEEIQGRGWMALLLLSKGGQSEELHRASTRTNGAKPGVADVKAALGFLECREARTYAKAQTPALTFHERYSWSSLWAVASLGSKPNQFVPRLLSGVGLPGESPDVLSTEEL
ncbi:hypothetical protein KM043_014659 [Ampulex compressa]|nr:hypothetical protein KM043_014659 [Ampulex compressa]